MLSSLRSTQPLLRRPSATARQLSTRPHPLSTRVSPRGPVPAGRTPPGLQPKVQRWSTLTAILLATLTGSATYIVGLQAGKPATPLTSYKEPTQARFDAALEELKSWIPSDCLAEDRDSLVSHGHSDWAGESRAGQERLRRTLISLGVLQHTIRMGCLVLYCTLETLRTWCASSSSRASTASP